LVKNLPAGISIKLEADKLVVSRADDSRDNRARHGLVRAHLANMVKGVTEGWTRELEINGVGYRAEVAGDTVTFALGYAHPIVFKLPKIISAKVEKNRLTLSSADKDLLGQIAAKVRELRPPEPYKGKGIKYVEEVIKRKVGKAAATGAAAGGG
jgi:large subunit ribosomal protein L6